MKIPVELDGKTYQTDAEGFLANPDEWSQALAEKMAQDDNCELTPEHWEAINILREYYAEYAIAPPIRVLVRHMGKRLGKEKANSPYLYELFSIRTSKTSLSLCGIA